MDMTNLNGYLVPKMAMKETHRPPVGRIGLQREKFLQENHSLLYDKMLLDGTLYSDLKQTEQRYWEQVEQTITKLLVSNPAPDKNNDPLGWTAHMNSLQAQAAELAIAMHSNGELRAMPTDYTDANVSAKVIKIIQSYTPIVNQTVWLKKPALELENDI